VVLLQINKVAGELLSIARNSMKIFTPFSKIYFYSLLKVSFISTIFIHKYPNFSLFYTHYSKTNPFEFIYASGENSLNRY